MSYDMELRTDTLYHRARCDVCGKTAENVIENTCLFPDADEADETATSNGWQVWLNESTGIIRHRCDDHWIADCAKCGEARGRPRHIVQRMPSGRSPKACARNARTTMNAQYQERTIER